MFSSPLPVAPAEPSAEAAQAAPVDPVDPLAELGERRADGPLRVAEDAVVALGPLVQLGVEHLMPGFIAMR